MRFEYTYRNTPGDYWRFYMGNTYSQWTGIVNVIFTAAFIALAVSRWTDTNILGKILMVLAVMIFPVFQPLAIFLRSLRQAGAIKPETKLSFGEKGIGITVEAHHQDIGWEKAQLPVKRPGLLVVFPDSQHAYLVPDRVTGEEKQELERYIIAHIKKKA